MTGLDDGPWPGYPGTTSPFPLSGKGEERWRVDLPSRHVSDILVAANGMCFVTSERGIHAFDGPETRWTADAWGGGVLLSDGLLATRRDEVVVVREQRTGSTVGVIEEIAHTFPVPMGDDLLVFRTSRQHEHLLRATTRTGELCWETPLSHFDMSLPVVTDDRVVVVDGVAVRAFDGAGRPLWTASHTEFRDEMTCPDTRPGEIAGPLVGLSDGKVLLGVLSDGLIGYLVMDPRKGEVRKVPRHLPPGRHVVPLHDPDTGRELIVLPGWSDSGDHGDSIPTVTVVDLDDGAVLQHHRVPADPRGMVAGATGVVAVAGSPDWKRWTRYHGWPGFDLRDQCYVLFLDKDGVRAEWKARKPITGPIAVGAEGDLLVPVTGQLVSLG